MSESETVSAYTRLVAMARRHPAFLGHRLAAYQAAHDLDDAALASWLGCDASALARLSLCRLPEDRHPRFRDDVLKIARFASCDPDRLIELLQSPDLPADAAPESQPTRP